MPLTSAIQSAMAIRHEREKRHQRRLSKIRRESGVEGLPGSGGSSHRPSVSSLGSGAQGRTGEQPEQELTPPSDKEDSTFSTFHMGIVFILLGFLMIFFSMIPSAVIKADWSQLLGVGVAFIFIGLIMVMVNRIINAREEEELSKYVKQRLCRSRSSAAAPLTPRPGDAEEGGGAAPPSDIPEIVAPEELPPSAMKGASGHPPRSPKDKVTFDLDIGGAREGGQEGVIVGEEPLPPLPPLLLPPCSLPLRLPAKPPPPLAVMEESGSELEEGADSLATPPSLPAEGGSSRGGSSLCGREAESSASLPPPSPGETQSLLPQEEQEVRRDSKRSY